MFHNDLSFSLKNGWVVTLTILVSDFYHAERPPENGLKRKHLCLDLLLNIYVSKVPF